jgi:hypothetical protein
MCSRPAVPGALNIDTPEYRAHIAGGCKQIPYHLPVVTDEIEQRFDRQYHAAMTAREAGQPYDAEIISLYQAPNYRELIDAMCAGERNKKR